MITESASVLVDIRKYDGTLSAQWTATRLGEDEHGVWLGTAQGVPVTSNTGSRTSRYAYVMLIPRGQWWTATFCADPGPEMYCDVCTVPEWNADETVLRTVDLDLDVVRPRGGEVHIEDEDEFAEHRVSYGYPDNVVVKARETCEWLAEVGRREGEVVEPFASTYRHWLGLVE
ncbi:MULTISPECIES: DUF402 domain-containing protein [unclassified Streptomyces]|uniref:DUF402 domain-containing protein n=1 Tax=unclassified Streptomyces TaxID=2593676 RepID=UPI00087EB4C0|nr:MULTISPECIES: DUF402 domain-containing protein [unclassified Streptomyces]PBC85936.1 hypothetical protein BX261_5976 [Streptomyces sp. 2321.6]SDR01739.1 hypothetical protein SAMN05216511_1284 [Streptomyces sp. KS_16]SED83466.1 hypothetical protein SAMN05428940_6001 [Streptomyces sp. 2133.1]SNC72817.1 hypothetical protein SAMN06272741_5902 [Streptomyces sp. 2114.4]